jgi:Protein of unknown function (DUF3618)
MAQQAPMDAAALRAEIERTRADLGQTVAALAAKTDVKARAKEAVADAADNVRRNVSSRAASIRASLDGSRLPVSAREPLSVATGAVIGALIGALIYAVRRRRA